MSLPIPLIFHHHLKFITPALPDNSSSFPPSPPFPHPTSHTSTTNSPSSHQPDFFPSTQRTPVANHFSHEGLINPLFYSNFSPSICPSKVYNSYSFILNSVIIFYTVISVD